MTMPLLILYAASALAGVVISALGFVAVSERMRLTPIYDDIMYAVTEYTLADTGLSGFAPSVAVDISVTIWNPNPYEITLTPTKPGKAFINGPGQEVAEATPLFVTIPMRNSREKPGIAVMTVNLTTTADLSDSLSALVDVLTGFGDFSIYYTYHLATEVSPTVFGIQPVSVDIAIDRFCEIKFSVGITGLDMEDNEVCGSDAEDFKAKGGVIRDEDGCGFFNSIPLIGGGCYQKRRRLAAAREASAQRRAKVAAAPSLPVTQRLAVRRLEGQAGQDTPIPADASVAAVDKDMLKKAQTQVDVGLGFVAFCCFVGALCCFVWPIKHFRKHAAQQKKLEQEQKEAEAQAQANAQAYEENYDAYEPPRKSMDMPPVKSQDLPRRSQDMPLDNSPYAETNQNRHYGKATE